MDNPGTQAGEGVQSPHALMQRPKKRFEDSFMPIELFRPFIPQEAVSQVVKAMGTRWVGQGPLVDTFEEQFKKMFHLDHAVALNSGSSALETAFDLLDLKHGDEVITTPLTCTATNLPLVRRGCKIVFADILKDTLCIDPEDVLRKATPKTRAVIQVHLGGIPAEEIVDCPVPVVTDAAQALGIFTGDITCCSFQAIKHITTGDGGMLTTSSARMARDARLLRWFGIDRSKKIKNDWQAYRAQKITYDIELPGAKRQMNDIAAAMGIAALPYYDQVIDYRRKLHMMYQDLLQGVSGIQVLDGPNNKNMYWLCTVLVERRDDFAKALFDAGIDTNVVQVRNDIYKIFGGHRQELPVMNAVEEKYLSLPLGMHVEPKDVEYICDVIKGGW